MLVPVAVKVGVEVEAVVERFQSGRVLEEEEEEGGGFERGVRKKTCFLIMFLFFVFFFRLLLGHTELRIRI